MQILSQEILDFLNQGCQCNSSGGGTPQTLSINSPDLVISGGNSLDLTLYGPFLTLKTGVQFNGRVDMRTNGVAFCGGGYHNVSASYTGFTITCSSAMTGGTIRVYGLRN